MEEMQTLAKAVITVALRDCVTIYNGKDFKYNGQPFIDKHDHIKWTKIKPSNIDVSAVEWFERTSREPLSYNYWLEHAEFNPNPIREFIEKLRSILNGAHLEDEKEDEREDEIVMWTEPRPHYIAKGYLPYARLNMHGKKWMNV